MARPGFYNMIRGPLGIPRGVGERPWGMPDTNVDDGFNEAFRAANEMKNRDMMRQKEMMALQEQMRLQANANDAIAARRNAAMAGPPKKNYVLGAGSGTGKLPPSTVEADNAARDAKAAQMNKEFAAVNEARQQRAATLASAEKIAGINAEGKLSAAENKGWSVVQRQDPTNPNRVQSFRMNNYTGQVEPIEYGDENLGGIAKPGTKLPVLNQGVTPEKLAELRSDAQSALDELNQLRDPETKKLRAHAAAASGKSNLFGIPEYIPGDPFRAAEGTAGFNALKAKLTLGIIQRLKAASKTGATGFGALNLKELGVLENSVMKAKTGFGGLSDEANEAELNRIGDRLEMILRDPEAAANTSGEGGSAPPGRSSETKVNPVKPAPKTSIFKNKKGVYTTRPTGDQNLELYGK